MDCKFISDTLDDVIQRGALDISKLMTNIMDEYDCKEGYFFQVQDIDEFVCNFSSNETKYKVGTNYKVDATPLDGFNVFIRDAIVAVLAFDNPPTELLEKLHNCIAVSLHFSNMQWSDRDFILKTTTQILDYLSDMLRQILDEPKITPNSQSEKNRLEMAVKDMVASVNILRDVHDYSLLTVDRLQLKPSDVNARNSIKGILDRVNLDLKYTIQDTVPQTINIDVKRFERNILLPVFLALGPIAPFVSIVFDVESTNFAQGLLNLSIRTAGGGAEIPKNLQKVIRSRYVIPEHLNLCMAKELCSVTGGFVKLYAPDNLLLCIGFKYTTLDNVWDGKRVILFIVNRTRRDKVYTMLTNMGANVTIFNGQDAALYLNTLQRYDVALLETENQDYITRYLRRIRERGLSVIGVGEDVGGSSFDDIVSGDSEREIVDTYRNILSKRE